jgi:hypothetical protein
MTVDPPAQVAVSLAQFRAVAGEVVVAVDSRVDTELLHAYRGVADRVLRYEFRPPVDRPRAWLYAQCSSDWILAIDGDEVPSAEMLEVLPDLVARRDVQQYAFPRRWLYPTLDSWIAELPWWPDFQLRLVRRDATLGLRGGLHGGVVPVLPALHVDAPLYHLDCVIKSEEERSAKALEYEAQQPGADAFGGGPLNQTLYLPERVGLSDLRPVAPDDIDVLTAVVAAGRQPAAPGVELDRPRRAPDLVAAGDIDAVVPSNRLPDTAYRVGLALFDRDERMAPGERRPVYLRVTNAGSAWWPWGLDQEPHIRVSYHWRTLDGAVVEYEGVRSPFTARLAPGETQIVPVWVEAPAAAGSYVLEFDLVHEHVRWFETPLAVAMEVGDRPC